MLERLGVAGKTKPRGNGHGGSAVACLLINFARFADFPNRINNCSFPSPCWTQIFDRTPTWSKMHKLTVANACGRTIVPKRQITAMRAGRNQRRNPFGQCPRLSAGVPFLEGLGSHH